MHAMDHQQKGKIEQTKRRGSKSDKNRGCSKMPNLGNFRVSIFVKKSVKKVLNKWFFSTFLITFLPKIIDFSHASLTQKQVKKGPQKWPKIGHFWPFFDPFLTLFWPFLTTFLTEIIDFYLALKTRNRIKKITQKMTKKSAIFCKKPLFYHFLTTFWPPYLLIIHGCCIKYEIGVPKGVQKVVKNPLFDPFLDTFWPPFLRFRLPWHALPWKEGSNKWSKNPLFDPFFDKKSPFLSLFSTYLRFNKAREKSMISVKKGSKSGQNNPFLAYFWPIFGHFLDPLFDHLIAQYGSIL